MSLFEIITTGFYLFTVSFLLHNLNPNGSTSPAKNSIQLTSLGSFLFLCLSLDSGVVNLEEFVFGSFILIAINLLFMENKNKGGK